MSYKRIFSVVFLVVFSFTLGIFTASKFLKNTFPISLDTKNISFSWNEDITSEKLFQEAYDIVQRKYFGFDSVRKEDITAGIIKWFVDSLWDKHSEYFNTEETKTFNEILSGDFEGIWAVVDKNEIGVLVKQVLAGTPAKEWGILQWDILLKANGEKLEWLSLADAIKKIRGKAETSVELEILRAQEKGVLIKKIIRKKITVPSVDGKLLENKTGYIILSMFGEKTEEEFLKKFLELKKQGATGYIIDLRDNGGGYLETAVNILSQFIEKGKIIVTTKENDAYRNESYFSHGDKDVNFPIVVLINENSASASEITAGALKDYNLAILVGEKSYGKGSVQQPFSLSDGSEMKITVAKWYTPLDYGIDKIGISPDIEVKLQKEDYEKWYDRQLEEAKNIMESYKKDGREKTISKYLEKKKEEAVQSLTSSGKTNSGSTK